MPGAVGINVIKDGNGTAIVGGVRMFDISGTGAGPWVPMSMLTDSSGNQLIGQKTMALSLPVAIASDQGDIPVKGTQTWKAGTLQGLTWGTAGFSTEVNSVINGNAVLAANQIDNSTALDQFFDLSVSLGSITPGAGAPYIGFYLVPLNQDGTTYGDGRFASSAAGPPASQYYVGSVPCVPSTAGVITGMVRSILLPPGKFKLILYNQAGATLASSANTIQMRSYNLAVA